MHLTIFEEEEPKGLTVRLRLMQDEESVKLVAVDKMGVVVSAGVILSVSKEGVVMTRGVSPSLDFKQDDEGKILVR